MHFFWKKLRKCLEVSEKPITFALALKHQAHRKMIGEVVEWSITAVLKTAVLRGTGGSNPSLSALKTAAEMLQFLFKKLVFQWWIRLGVRTDASHASNRGSIPLSTTTRSFRFSEALFFVCKSNDVLFWWGLLGRRIVSVAYSLC